MWLLAMILLNKNTPTDLKGLTHVSPNYDFPHECLMPNCNEDYWPKSSTNMFKFDNLLGN